MKYRPEIDGLRAVAVLPVMAFHAGLPPFAGGYVGVDVFFVISGYLITTILLDDIVAERFSIVRFYERRVRRILPALFVVIAVCLPFAWAWMLPDAFENFGQSIVATVLFSNNVLLWLTSGYFAQAAETKPLLHTWSLGVEEQFYILFPLLLAVLARPARIRAALLVLGLTSFALMQYSVMTGLLGAEARFYLLPTRAWELLAGAGAALLLREHPPRIGRPVASGLAGLGLIMVLGSMLLLDPGPGFPSLVTLFPVGGTVLIIVFAAPDGLVGRLLAHRGPVAIGLISYSAYLWHQPVFVLYELRAMTEITVPVGLALIALSLGLAALTWRLVEQPFRKGSKPLLARRGTLFGGAVAASAALCMVGVVSHMTQGMPGRIDPEIRALIALAKVRSQHQETCEFGPWEDVPPHPVAQCKGFMPSGTPDVLIIGDSHAGAIAQTVQEHLKADGIESYAVSYLGCPALPGLFRVDLGPRHGCDSSARGMRDYLHRSGAQAVVIMARFTIGWAGVRFDNGEGGVGHGEPNPIDLLTFADESASATDPARRARFLDAVSEGLSDLADEVPVILVDPVPETGWRIPERVAGLIQTGTDPGRLEISTSRAAYLERNHAVRTLFDELTHPQIFRARIAPHFCDAATERCRATQAGRPLYLDNNHLSPLGAELVAPTIAEAVRRALASNPQK